MKKTKKTVIEYFKDKGNEVSGTNLLGSTDFLGFLLITPGLGLALPIGLAVGALFPIALVLAKLVGEPIRVIFYDSQGNIRGSIEAKRYAKAESERTLRSYHYSSYADAERGTPHHNFR